MSETPVIGDFLSAPRFDGRELLRRAGEWARENLLLLLVQSAVAALLGWGLNVWFIARRYDGVDKVPSGGLATSRSNLAFGFTFWVLVGLVVFGLIAYWRAVGTRRLGLELRGTPGRVRSLVGSVNRARVDLLWGFGVGAAATAVLLPSASFLVGVGVGLAVATRVSALVVQLAYRLWTRLVGRFLPNRAPQAQAMMRVAVALLGSSVALLLSFLVPSTPVRLMLAGVSLLAAVILARVGGGRAATAVLLVSVTVMLAVGLFDPMAAYADDGGWQECQNAGYSDYLDCPGVDDVLKESTYGGLAAALGALVGAVLGSATGLVVRQTTPSGQEADVPSVPPEREPQNGPPSPAVPVSRLLRRGSGRRRERGEHDAELERSQSDEVQRAAAQDAKATGRDDPEVAPDERDEDREPEPIPHSTVTQKYPQARRASEKKRPSFAALLTIRVVAVCIAVVLVGAVIAAVLR